jgi:hypothetical protein
VPLYGRELTSLVSHQSQAFVSAVELPPNVLVTVMVLRPRILAHHAFRPESPGHALSFPITQTVSGPFLSACCFCYTFWGPEIMPAFFNRSHHITVLDHSSGKSRHRKDSLMIAHNGAGDSPQSTVIMVVVGLLVMVTNQVHVIRGTDWLPAPSPPWR